MRNFKKLIAIFFCLILVFLLATACDNTENQNPDNEKENEEITENKEEEKETEALTLTPDVDDGVAGRRNSSNERTAVNESTSLVLSGKELSGNFNPFYSSIASDYDILNMTQILFLSINEYAEPAVGIEYPVLVYEYKTTVDANQTSTSYEFVLKSGIKFSDGKLITANDVLFTLYELLDPAYSGQISLNTVPIQGLESYRLQVKDVAAAENKSDEFYEEAQNMIDTAIAGEDEKTLNRMWEKIKTCLENDLDALILYEYKPSDLKLDFPENYPENSIILVYLGAIDYNGEYILDESTGLDAENIFSYTKEEFIEGALAFVKANYTPATYDKDFGWDCVDKIKSELVVEIATKHLDENKGTVPNISGIKKGLKLCDDGNVRETVTITINGVDPKNIWNFFFFVAPMHYYAGEERAAKANGYDYFGVDFANEGFQELIKSKNGIPMGAGPYKITDINGSENPTAEGFFDNGTCYFTANDYFLMGSPKIKNVNFKIVESGSELEALKSGEVHYAEPQAASSVIDLLTSDSAFSSMNYEFIENLGYTYIGISASEIPNINVRRALMSAMNTELSILNYSDGFAEVIHRSVNKSSWAYPQDATAYYPFDETGETSKAFFLAAGYQEIDGKIADASGEPLSFTFIIPSKNENHSIKAVFEKAKEIFEKFDISVSIEMDDSILPRLEKGEISVWTASWTATVEPDIFDVYFSDNTINKSPFPIFYGLYWLYENGTEEEQSILNALNAKILESTKILDTDERKPIFAEAYDLLMKIAVELPVFQDKGMYVYNKDVIDESSLFQNVTSYKGAFTDIWNVSLVEK